MLKATKVCFVQHQNTEKAPKGNEKEVLQKKNNDPPPSVGRGMDVPLPEGGVAGGPHLQQQSHFGTGSYI